MIEGLVPKTYECERCHLLVTGCNSPPSVGIEQSFVRDGRVVEGPLPACSDGGKHPHWIAPPPSITDYPYDL